MTTRFQIRGTIYKAEDINSVRLVDTFVFDEQVFQYRQTKNGTDFPDLHWSDVEVAVQEISGLSEQEAARHRRANLVLASTLWLTMRSAGSPMSFGDVIELDMTKDLVWLPEASDKANPTKPPAKSQGSAAAAGKPKRAVAAKS